MNQTPRAYAYVRFSSSKQKDGDSIRRQLESARDYCKRNKIFLDEREFTDFAKSAYRRSNIKKGSALSAFLALVDSGEIASGSYLLIETVDRLTRADVYSAVTLFGSILQKGILIVETAKNQVYNEKSLTQFAAMLSIMSSTLVAFDESSKKALRSAANWDRRQTNAREFATPLTRECPRWLRVSEDGKKYEVLQDKVRSIQFVFELRKSGLGATAIARKCNELKLSVPGKGDIWHLSLVNRLINNAALIGQYQPYKVNESGRRVPHGDPIPYFYPSVISTALFNAVQQINNKSKEFPKKRDSAYRNFLQGLLFCSCGASLHRKLKSRLDLDYSRYYCSRSNLNATKCPSVDCRRIEDTVIFFMSEEAPGLVSLDDFSDKLLDAENSARESIKKIDAQISLLLNLVQAGKAEDTPASILQRISDLEREKTVHQKIAERMILETKDTAVYWGVKADEAFVNAIRSADSEKLSLLRYQISRIVLRFDLSEDLSSLKVTLKNSKTFEISVIRKYFDF